MDMPKLGSAAIDEDGIVSLAFQVTETEIGKNGGIGEMLFRGMLEVFKGRIQGIKASWANMSSLGDNLSSFNRIFKETKDEAKAVWGTFTGKMAKEAGYTEYQILPGRKVDPKTGETTLMEVLFTKKKE